MKKCKCGKEIKDNFDLCYKCAQVGKEGPTTETPNDRQTSIERQVAAKCTAQHCTGQEANYETIGNLFVKYLELITGRKAV